MSCGTVQWNSRFHYEKCRLEGEGIDTSCKRFNYRLLNYLIKM